MVLNNSFKAIETTGVTSDITDEQSCLMFQTLRKMFQQILVVEKKDTKSKAIEENAKC